MTRWLFIAIHRLRGHRVASHRRGQLGMRDCIEWVRCESCREVLVL